MVLMVDIILWPIVQFLRIFVGIPIKLIYSCKKKRSCPVIDDDLLLIPANQLVQKIIKQEVQCHTVVNRYINRINIVNPIVNAVVEERFVEALKEAAAVDEMITQKKFSEEELLSNYPLLGIPVSVKESITVRGMSNAAGSLAAKDKIGMDDADIVTAIKRAGAIVILVSNTPELCLNWETSNKVTGTTCNPYDSRRTSGGSSGGEAALLGAGASLIGLGSDIAGSLRLPAHFCGIFSHKPTARSVSVEGHYPDCSDKDKWWDHFILGPMARYATDLPIVFKAIVKPEMRTLLNLDNKVAIDKLRFYYLDTNGNILCGMDGCIINALNSVVKYFHEKLGKDVQKLKFKQTPYVTVVPLLEINNTDDIFYKDTKVSIYLELLKYIFGRSKGTLNAILYFLIRNIAQKCISARRFENTRKLMLAARKDLENILGEDGVLFYPTYTTTAHYHGSYIAKLLDCTYCTVFNTYGLPSTNCPIGYDSRGLPIGIQVIAKRNCDRLTLAVAEEIENAFGGWKFSPRNS